MRDWMKRMKKHYIVWGIILILAIDILVFTVIYDEITEPVGVTNGSSAQYHLDFKLHNDGLFSATSKINVKNISDDNWDHIQFYFIPNAFTEGNKPFKIGGAAEVKINRIEVAGIESGYTLEQDLLNIFLNEKLDPDQEIEVLVDYEFTVPTDSLRFNQVQDNYYLAQAYPMLATYQDNNWNQVKYSPNYESYHTDFSNYKITVDLPEGYSMISTSDKDLPPGENKGEVEVKNAKEVYIGIIKDMEMVSKSIGDVEIRAFGREENIEQLKVAVDIGESALSYFSKNIGDYPFKQFDILVEKDLALGMEYPGIVHVNEDDKLMRSFRNTVIHETAHQWFYGVISSDPYSEAWLDEGLTEFATVLYWRDQEKLSDDEALWFVNRRLEVADEKGIKKQPSNLLASDIKTPAYIYSQPAAKMWELFDENGGEEEAKKFLQAYYKRYAYKQVNTEHFVKFTKDYFKMENDDFFEDWLVLD
jgi:hypothetical protein